MSTDQFEPGAEAAEPESLSNRQQDEMLYSVWKNNPTPRNLTNIVNRFNGVINKKVNEQAGSIPKSALHAEARSWVVHAIKTYDPTRGASLNTHVNHWVRKVSRINMENQNAARLSESQQLKFRHYNTGLQELSTQLNREPTHQELAGHLNWPIRQVKKMQREIQRDLYESGEEGSPTASSFDSNYLVHGYVFDNLNEDERKLVTVISAPENAHKTGAEKAAMLGVNLNRFNYLQKKLVDKMKGLKTEMESIHAASAQPRKFPRES